MVYDVAVSVACPHHLEALRHELAGGQDGVSYAMIDSARTFAEETLEPLAGK